MKWARVLTAVAVGGLSLTTSVVHAEAATCKHAQGPFSIRNGHITDRTGRFTPYGINLTGIRLRGGSYSETVATNEAQEDAASSATWCANLIRMPVSVPMLIVHGKTNRAYLSAIDAVVKHGEADGMAMVLVGSRSWTPIMQMPEYPALEMWRVLAYHYGRDHQVIFDLWNEPHIGSWWAWRNGGRESGKRFYGMQYLANYIRGQHATNLLWIEGIHVGGDLRQVPKYRISHDGPIAYSIHRPPGAHDSATWWSYYGFLAGHFAVVEGEWAMYSRANADWACWGNAKTSVPAYFRWLAKKQIGIVAYDLTSPRLLESNSLTDPNRIKSNWACRTGLNQGAGHQLMRWYQLHNG
jgi:hypothetical protein